MAAASLTASWHRLRRSCEVAAEDDQLKLSKEQELLSAGGRSQGEGGVQRLREEEKKQEGERERETEFEGEEAKEKRRRGSPISGMDLCLTWTLSCIPHMQGGSRRWSLQPDQKVL